MSLNISDFSLFFMKKLQPPEKCHLLSSLNPPLKTGILSNVSFWKFCRRLNPCSRKKGRGRGAHYEYLFNYSYFFAKANFSEHIISEQLIFHSYIFCLYVSNLLYNTGVFTTKHRQSFFFTKPCYKKIKVSKVQSNQIIFQDTATCKR